MPDESVWKRRFALYTAARVGGLGLAGADMGATGLEILGEAHVQDYPDPPTQWIDAWFARLERHRLAIVHDAPLRSGPREPFADDVPRLAIELHAIGARKHGRHGQFREQPVRVE